MKGDTRSVPGMLSRMDIAAVLANFNEQMRRHPAAEPGVQVELDTKTTRLVASRSGWSAVIWSDLGDDDLEETTTSEIERFSGQVQSWEWKYYSYDCRL